MIHMGFGFEQFSSFPASNNLITAIPIYHKSKLYNAIYIGVNTVSKLDSETYESYFQACIKPILERA